MISVPKKVIAIHDLSTVGRCALSVIMPVISILGVQVYPVPTSLLSAHTGGFNNIKMTNESNFLEGALEHYRGADIDADCIYSGFLANADQIDIVRKYMKHYDKAIKIVDPVMGDNGKRYSTCSDKHVEKMRELIKYADVITPNLTEVYMLLDKPYDGKDITEEQAIELLEALLEKMETENPSAIITGVNGGFEISNYCINKEGVYKSTNIKHEASFPGTGDIFTSIITANLLKGNSLYYGMSQASVFTGKCIEETIKAKTDRRYGVLLEPLLKNLTTDTNIQVTKVR